MTAVLKVREPSARYLARTERTLLQSYEDVALVPGGAARLRQLVRSLAVRGLLSRQSGADESADHLLVRFKRLKRSRGTASSSKAQSSSNDLLTKPTGLELPLGWAWASLGDLGSFASGKTPSTGKVDYWNGAIPWVTPKDMKAARVVDSEDHVTEKAVADGLALVPESAVLVVVRSGILRRTVPVAVSAVRCTINQDLKALTLYEPAMAAYVQLLIAGFEPFILSNLTKIGTTVESIKFDEFAACQFPIPPLAEQQRIVARVEELMKLCDALEQSGRLADEQHARLTSTLFDALAASKSAHALAENWQRIAEHFDLLLDRPEAIDALEQAILQLAVRGLLVAQVAGEPLSHQLVGHATAQQKALRGTSRSAALDVNESDPSWAEPFQLHDSWQWVRIEDICDVQGGIQKTQLRRPMNNHFPYLRVANVQRDRLKLDRIERYELTDDEVGRWALKAGDLLVVEGNGSADEVGRCAMWDGSIAPCVFQNHLIRVRPDSAGMVGFLKLFLNSPDGTAEMKRLAVTTSGLYNLSVGKIRKILVPLPPLDEQLRIVARVEELRRLCTDLRERLAEASRTQSQLADALVAEAVA